MTDERLEAARRAYDAAVVDDWHWQKRYPDKPDCEADNYWSALIAAVRAQPPSEAEVEAAAKAIANGINPNMKATSSRARAIAEAALRAAREAGAHDA